jgi:hypothetical protein
MKNLVTIAMCLIALLCSMSYAGESNNVIISGTPGIVAWGVMDNSLERIIGIRAGYATDFNVEVGVTALWQHEAEWDTTPDYYGGYVAYWIDELATVGDSDGFSGIEDLLHLLAAKPYAILIPLFDDQKEEITVGVGAGAAFYAKDDIKQRIALTTEYVAIGGYENKLTVGIRIKF